MENFKQTLIKRIYNYCLNIIKFADKANKKDYSILIIIKQLIRSATSIGANVIEAQAASSKRDFINFLNHALKSANESKFWLGLLKYSRKGDSTECEKLLNETIELAKIIASSILTLKGKKNF